MDLLTAMQGHVADASSINWQDVTTWSGGTLAVVLGALWLFTRILRKIVGFAFMLCVIYLVVKVAFDVDLAEYVLPMLESESATPELP